MADAPIADCRLKASMANSPTNPRAELAVRCHRVGVAYHIGRGSNIITHWGNKLSRGAEKVLVGGVHTVIKRCNRVCTPPTSLNFILTFITVNLTRWVITTVLLRRGCRGSAFLGELPAIHLSGQLSLKV